MTAKSPISQSDLQQHLAVQTSFLEASVESFDRGFEDEAKRLAVTIRVLVHDTANSRSLLSQLNMKTVDFFDTALDPEKGNLSSEFGLVNIALGEPETKYFAPLDGGLTSKFVSFVDWWNKPVFKDKNERVLTRRDLILTASNQDGGAHVDPELNDVYADLSKRNSLGFMVSDGRVERPMEGPEKVAIRQVAHEILRTLKPDYRKSHSTKAGIIIGGTSVTKTANAPDKIKKSMEAKKLPKVGRNKKCPCGSGKKYKHCHGPFR